MTEFEKGYEQGYKDGVAGAALPNVNDNGDKIDSYDYAYKTDSRGEPYIHIDSVRNMPKKAANAQPLKHGRWESPVSVGNGIKFCSVCRNEAYWDTDYGQQLFDYCPYCGARMDGDTE